MTSIKKQIEAYRKEIKKKAEEVRKKTPKGICANCGRLIGNGNRTFCSDECANEFYHKYDYSKSSPLIKAKIYELRTIRKEKRKAGKWKIYTARQEYRCFYCGRIIYKKEKYYKYEILPHDEHFRDFPYAIFRAHVGCLEFADKIAREYEFEDSIRLNEDEFHCILSTLSDITGLGMKEIESRIKKNEDIDSLVNTFISLRENIQDCFGQGLKEGGG